MENVENLRVLLANIFVMYFKAQSYHWNVEGKNFSQMHDFFGELYRELHGVIDVTAEEIRALDQYAPISLNDLYNFKTIAEDTMMPSSCQIMLGNLLAANGDVIDSLNKLFKTAEATNMQGLADFAANRLDIHAKHGWMLRAFMKGE
jgi:starvation-inducible DNA-binding protein